MIMTDKKHATIKSLQSEMKASENETDDRLNALESSIGELTIDIDTKFSEVLDAIRSQAKNNPVSISKDGVDCRDVHQHKDEDKSGVIFADGRPENDVELIEISLTSSDSAEFKEKADQVMFDKEEIEIRVMPSGSSYPDFSFSVGINGKMKAIMRGQNQWVQRNYVEVLLRAKTSNFGNIETVNQLTGDKSIIYPETKSHRYPLQVITDNSPKGAKWLERVLNDRAA